MKLFSVLLLLSLVSFSACTHKNSGSPLSGDYLIAGYTGGFAGNIFSTEYLLINSYECVKTTHVVGEKVPSDNTKFNFNNVQSAAKYDSVKGLLHSVPAELLSRNNSQIGIDAPDAGYTDVRASMSGVAYRWQFLFSQDSSSAAVQQFVSNLRAALN